MPRDTLVPYSWPRSVSWCLAEGYGKRRSAPPHRPLWPGKDNGHFRDTLQNQSLDWCKSPVFKTNHLTGAKARSSKPITWLVQKPNLQTNHLTGA